MRDVYNFNGRVLGRRFRLDSFIDEGGMGLVYLGTDLRNEKKVAIKLLHPRFSSKPLKMAPYLRAFETEGKVLESLRHDNIVRMYDVGTDDGLAYIAMEYLDGINLEDRIHRDGPIPIPECSNILSQIANALDYAHKRKIVHLDIKAANIFLIESGEEYNRVKVLDFGLARFVQSTMGTTLSRVIGTPQYIAPEVYKNQASSLSDVYSLGVLTFFMLTGNLPFSGSHLLELMASHTHARPPSARQRCPTLSQFNDELISLVLAKDPTERPKSTGSFARHFEKGLTEDGPLIEFETKRVLPLPIVYVDDPRLGGRTGIRNHLGTLSYFVFLAFAFGLYFYRESSYVQPILSYFQVHLTNLQQYFTYMPPQYLGLMLLGCAGLVGLILLFRLLFRILIR